MSGAILDRFEIFLNIEHTKLNTFDSSSSFDDHAELIGSIMSWFKEDNSNFCKQTFENALKDELAIYNNNKLAYALKECLQDA